jgi:transcriptional regulator with XRE-family HTH domain
MEIGKRLYELREAKGLTQDELGNGVGLAPARISQVENGHVAPSLALLESWAKALDVELYQLFFVGDGASKAPELPEHIPVPAQERSLLGLFHKMGSEERSLLVSLARGMAKRMGKGA